MYFFSFMLCKYITMHGAKNMKFDFEVSPVCSQKDGAVTSNN